jgi:hypothetical protein
MTIQEAITTLSYAENIEHWNELREKIKSQVSEDEWFKEYMPIIDGSGLVVVILGKD